MGAMDPILSTSADTFREYMENNVIGTHEVVRQLVPALLGGAAKKLIFISSQGGSMQRQIGVEIGFRGAYVSWARRV